MSLGQNQRQSSLAVEVRADGFLRRLIQALPEQRTRDGAARVPNRADDGGDGGVWKMKNMANDEKEHVHVNRAVFWCRGDTTGGWGVLVKNEDT